MSERARALSKVCRMLRLADDSASTDGERANAIRAADRLITAHSLTVGEIRAEQDRVRLDEAPLAVKLAVQRQRQVHQQGVIIFGGPQTTSGAFGNGVHGTVRIVFR